MKQISKPDVMRKLRALVSYDVKIKHLAERFEVSAPFMSAVLAGKKDPTEVMLQAVNAKKSVIYTEKGK